MVHCVWRKEAKPMPRRRMVKQPPRNMHEVLNAALYYKGITDSQGWWRGPADNISEAQYEGIPG